MKTRLACLLRGETSILAGDFGPVTGGLLRENSSSGHLASFYFPVTGPIIGALLLSFLVIGLGIPSALQAREPETLPPLSAAPPGSELSGMEQTRHVAFHTIIEAALRNHLDLNLAALDKSIAHQQREMAWHSLLPTLSIGGGFSHLQGRRQGAFGGLQQVNFERYDPQFGLTLELNPGERIHDLHARRHQYTAAHYRHLDTRQKVLLEVSRLYQDLQVAWAGATSTRQLVKERRRIAELVRWRVEGGVAQKSDLAQAQAALADARSQWVKSANRWRQASIQLARVLRWNPKVLLLPSGERPKPHTRVSPSSSNDEARVQRPDLQALRQQVKVTQERQAAAKWQLWGPSLQLQWRHTQLGTSPADLGHQEYFRVLLGWRFSLADWDRIQLRRRKLEKARTRLKQLEETTRSKTAAALNRIRAAKERIPLTRKRLQASREHVELASSRYREGKTNLLEVLNAETDLAQARFDLAKTVSAYNLAQVRYLAAVGELEPERLLSPDSSEGAP